jgi:YD repeat-containing protein
VIPNRDSLAIGGGTPVTTTYAGRLTRVRTTGGTTIATYTYDALDRLRHVTRSGTTLRMRNLGTTFTASGSNVVRCPPEVVFQYRPPS